MLGAWGGEDRASGGERGRTGASDARGNEREGAAGARETGLGAGGWETRRSSSALPPHSRAFVSSHGSQTGECTSRRADIRVNFACSPRRLVFACRREKERERENITRQRLSCLACAPVLAACGASPLPFPVRARQ